MDSKHGSVAPAPSAVRSSRDGTANLELSGWKAALVGGTGGIGRSIAGFLAAHDASVLVVGRTFRDQGKSRIDFMEADLSLLREARRVGRVLPAESLDLLVLTTGIMAARKREETAEGIELDMAVSYLSRLVILQEVAPRLGRQRTAPRTRPRVFIMGFPGKGHAGSAEDLNAEKSYNALAVHMNTVAGNEMLVLESTKRYPNIDFFGLNPGMISTNIRAKMLGQGSVKHRLAEWLIRLFSISADDYAGRIAPLLVATALDGRSGAMFNNKGLEVPASPKLTAEHTSRFMEASEVLVARAFK